MRVRNSVTGELLFEGWRRGQTALASSTIAGLVMIALDDARTIAQTSRVAEMARGASRVARASWLSRWLTREPEPDVIVIDLRETATVGPILALLERFLAPIVRHWGGARIRTVSLALYTRFLARPIQVGSFVVITAILANLFVLVALDSPTADAVGARLLVVSLALAGTRVTLSADELTDTRAFEALRELLSPPDPPERADGDGRLGEQ